MTPDRIVTDSTYNLVAIGDSMTIMNSGTSNTGYAKVCAALLGSGRSIIASYSAFGINGASWLDAYSQGPYLGKTIDDLSSAFADARRVPGLINILLGFAGTNGMFLDGNSAATEFSNFQTWYAARIAAGWSPGEILVITVLPRQSDASFNTKRLAYNADVVSYGTSEGFLVADVSDDTTIGTEGDENDLTYYQSGGIHLNGTGQTYLATNLVYPLIP